MRLGNQNRSRTRAIRHGRIVSILCAVVAVIGVLATGCRTRSLVPSTGYGRISGSGYADSLNGTRAFRNLLVDSGFAVKKIDKLTPRLDRFQHAVWFVADRRAPTEEAVERWEQWLREGYDRTLIVVGRDFDADVLYWQDLLGQTSDPVAREFYRYRLALAKSRQDLERTRPVYDFSGPSIAPTPAPSAAPAGAPALQCDWYHLETTSEFRGRHFRGPVGEVVNMDQTAIYCREWLAPNATAYDFQPMLLVDGIPFMYSLSRPEWDGGRVVVIANGSFLLNYSLTNPEHRALAQLLIDDSMMWEDVAFLESDAEVTIRENDYEMHNQWAWIANPPLRYIVPHLLFWGVIFSFVIFPIFGRPRRLPHKPTTRFRDHVEALGKLLKRTDSPDQARRWIEEYHHWARKDRPLDESAPSAADSETKHDVAE